MPPGDSKAIAARARFRFCAAIARCKRRWPSWRGSSSPTCKISTKRSSGKRSRISRPARQGPSWSRPSCWPPRARASWWAQGESADLEKFHAEHRKWLGEFLLGKSCDPECRGKLLDVMLSVYGESDGDYDETMRRLLALPRPNPGPLSANCTRGSCGARWTRTTSSSSATTCWCPVSPSCWRAPSRTLPPLKS
jgi:hypothetical protein